MLAGCSDNGTATGGLSDPTAFTSGMSGNSAPDASGDTADAQPTDAPDSDATSATPPTSGTTTDTTGSDVTVTNTGTDSGPSSDPSSDPTSDPSSDPTTDTATSEPMTTDPPPGCGNGTVDGSEDCDDGNAQNGDGCENNCTFTPECGNGEVEAGEVCDDGNTADGDTCSADCDEKTQPPGCGDGIVQPPEMCDDGNAQNGDGCENNCAITPSVCGDGVLEQDEECDDGNDVDGGPNDFCTNSCTDAICQAPNNYVVCDQNLTLTDKATKPNAHKAMGICNDMVGNSVKITNYSFSPTDGLSWQVAKGFGNFFKPREGGTLLMLSTGKIAAPNGQGIVVEANNSQLANGANGNPDNQASLPAPLKAVDGSGGTPLEFCDGTNDCSDTLQAQWAESQGKVNDWQMMRFNTTTPDWTFGYSFEFAVCYSEWPIINDHFQDMFIVWQDMTDGDPPYLPYTGNVTFLPGPNEPRPLTPTNLTPHLNGAGSLTGTGFEGNGCTDWLTVKGPSTPGAALELAFFLADTGDTTTASVVLLDNFRWECAGCDPGSGECGVLTP